MLSHAKHFMFNMCATYVGYWNLSCKCCLCGISYIVVLFMTIRSQALVITLYLCPFRHILALRLQFLCDPHLKMPVWAVTQHASLLWTFFGWLWWILCHSLCQERVLQQLTLSWTHLLILQVWPSRHASRLKSWVLWWSTFLLLMSWSVNRLLYL